MGNNDDLQCISILPWASQGNCNYISWNNLVSLLRGGDYFVAHWNRRQMNIFRLPDQEVRKEPMSALKSAVQLCQDVSFPEPVLQAFEWAGKFFFITASGFLKVLNFDDSTLRFFKDGKVCFKTIFSLSAPKKFLRACPLIGNVLLVSTVFNGCITIDIYNVDTLSDDMEVYFVDSVLLEKQEPLDGNASVAMCVCSANIASHLMGAKSDKCTVMLVGLNSGSIYWLPFINDSPTVPKAKKLYHAGRKVLGINSSKGSSCVFVLLDGGVMIVINCSNTKDKNSEDNDSNSNKVLKFDIVALPGSIREFCTPADSRSILCSDGTRCWLVKLVADDAAYIQLSLTGVTGLLGLPYSNVCLATTKYNTFYTVNLTGDLASCEKNTPATQKYCDLETPYQYISELKKKTNDLLQVEKALQVEDSVFSAIAAASRGDILRKSFSGRVLVYNVDDFDPFDERAHGPPTDGLYRLHVEVKNNSSIDFSASLWNICISILTHNGGVLSKSVPLPSAFVHTCPFSTNIFIRLQSKDLASEPKVLVNLIANLPEPDTARWISIPLIEECLDVSYFVTVISNAEKVERETKAVPIYDQIDKLLGKTPVDRQCVCFSINVPTHLRVLTALMQKLLSKCKHRCEDFLKQIKGGTDQRDFRLLFGDVSVSITFSPTISELTISSTSTEMVHAVKLWVIRCFSSADGEGSAAPDIGSRAKWLRSVLEKELVKSTIDVGHLKDIYREVRNNLSAGLPS